MVCGEEWDSERCHRTVLKVLSGGQFSRVGWDIDGRSQRVGVANLQLEAEEAGLEPPAEGRRVVQPFSYLCGMYLSTVARKVVRLLVHASSICAALRIFSQVPLNAFSKASFTAVALAR